MNRAKRRRIEKQRRKTRAGQPVELDNLLGEALRELQDGNLGHADKLFTTLVNSHSREPTSLHFAGVTKYQQGLYAEALKLLSAAVQIAPNYAQAHNSLGIVYLEQRNYQQAQKCFESAISIEPDYSNAYINLGSALKELKKMSDSITAYQAALKYNPNSSEARYKLAASFLALDNSEDALSVANNCLTIDRYCQNASAYKAMALLQLGRKSEWDELYNYDSMITKMHLSVPPEFISLESFNKDLEREICNHKTLTWEPLERVTHGGAVTKDILINPSETIKAFKMSLCNALDARITQIRQQPDHPFFSRVPTQYRLTLIASILQAQGWHPPHIHESAWLSGVYYVKVPPIIDLCDEKHSGYLQFGEPDFDLPKNWQSDVTLIKPEQGMAVCFPSYFFHGTIPYTGDGERIGIAFDVYPM